MRLFVAIEPPDQVLAELSAATGRLRPAPAELRWTRRQSWHLTLAFLGEVDERVLPDLGIRLERAARRHPPQRLSIAGAGAFPSAARGRVLWAGIQADRQALTALANSVAAGARRAGAPPPDEGRKYHPHLTLARCREPTDLTELAADLAGFAGSTWTASEIALIASYLGAEPRYTELQRWALRAKTGAQ
jgi:2'-5' RNA ligase